ncbi:hypothetical protein MNBD_ALPHA03-286 [hydrothermal vent metagenome]|uniref:PAS domain-containing protein n=1 Tax=hydrothermal vent metagenome TaxID=652676 RepID=A0A3B1B8T1_9ZZZZ
MPSRADLNPADIVSLLPHIALVDVEGPPRRYKFRLVGTETVKAMGLDITGKYLDQLPGAEQYLKDRYDNLVETKTPYWHSGKLVWSTKSFIDYSVVGMPLSSDGLIIDKLLFGLFYQFPIEKRTKFIKIQP